MSFFSQKSYPQPAKLITFAQLFHELHIKLQIVHRRQAHAKWILADKEMAQIAFGVILAQLAITIFVHRRKIFFEFFVVDIDGFIEFLSGR